MPFLPEGYGAGVPLGDTVAELDTGVTLLNTAGTLTASAGALIGIDQLKTVMDATVVATVTSVATEPARAALEAAAQTVLNKAHI